MARERLLRDLIELRRPVQVVLGELSTLSWDSPEVVVLERTDAVRMLDSFIDGRTSADECVQWADALECGMTSGWNQARKPRCASSCSRSRPRRPRDR